MLGAGENGNTGYLTTNACSVYYLALDLAAGDPFIINNNFPLQARPLPRTGFAPGRQSEVGEQTQQESYYLLGGMQLHIPKLGLTTSLVGVPAINGEWNVSWLGNQAGYLTGTAFPTWSGNTVITGHVWNADNSPGIFLDLKELSYGDLIQIYAWGDVYTYQVQSNRLVSPYTTQAVLGHKEGDWVTLFTCEGYGQYWGDYGYRRVVQAFLLNISPAD
jgi:LPXTG-site transpeptidase (sortase) family protein